jgi:hypothetical protein
MTVYNFCFLCTVKAMVEGYSKTFSSLHALKLRKSTTCSRLISTGVNKVVRPTVNSIVNMLLQHCSTVTTWNNMVDNLFIVGRTTLFTPVDINLEQPVRF